MSSAKRDIDAVIATNRFGLGARPDDINLAKQNPKKWLITGLHNITPPANAVSAIEMMQYIADYKKHRNQMDMMREQQDVQMPDMSTELAVNKPEKTIDIFRKNSALIIKEAIQASNSMNWRLLDFFSNHFSVTAHNRNMRALAPSLDWDAIAPNLMRSFERMLTAVISHPAMLVYLNNEKSVGPNSKQGSKRERGLNENLAREILELHTLGIGGGYQQSDVLELAKAITGWGISTTNHKNDYKVSQAFVFRNASHEPGTRTVLGKRYPAKNGSKQARAILKDLAMHPSTITHVCTKLATHFISDTPPTALINEMKTAWQTNNGNLKAVYIAMLNSPLAWQATQQKFKTPREYVISTLRAMNEVDIDDKILINKLNDLGQQPYSAGSPAGFGDTKASWNGSDALFTRIQWASALAKHYRDRDVNKLISTALGNSISEHSRRIIKRAESQQQAITLLLTSPEFLYR